MADDRRSASYARIVREKKQSSSNLGSSTGGLPGVGGGSSSSIPSTGRSQVPVSRGGGVKGFETTGGTGAASGDVQVYQGSKSGKYGVEAGAVQVVDTKSGRVSTSSSQYVRQLEAKQSRGSKLSAQETAFVQAYGSSGAKQRLNAQTQRDFGVPVSAGVALLARGQDPLRSSYAREDVYYATPTNREFRRAEGRRLVSDVQGGFSRDVQAARFLEAKKSIKALEEEENLRFAQTTPAYGLIEGGKASAKASGYQPGFILPGYGKITLFDTRKQAYTDIPSEAARMEREQAGVDFLAGTFEFGGALVSNVRPVGVQGRVASSRLRGKLSVSESTAPVRIKVEPRITSFKREGLRGDVVSDVFGLKSKSAGGIVTDRVRVVTSNPKRFSFSAEPSGSGKSYLFIEGTESQQASALLRPGLFNDKLRVDVTKNGLTTSTFYKQSKLTGRVSSLGKYKSAAGEGLVGFTEPKRFLSSRESVRFPEYSLETSGRSFTSRGIQRVDLPFRVSGELGVSQSMVARAKSRGPLGYYEFKGPSEYEFFNKRTYYKFTRSPRLKGEDEFVRVSKSGVSRDVPSLAGVDIKQSFIGKGSLAFGRLPKRGFPVRFKLGQSPNERRLLTIKVRSPSGRVSEPIQARSQLKQGKEPSERVSVLNPQKEGFKPSRYAGGLLNEADLVESQRLISVPRQASLKPLTKNLRLNIPTSAGGERRTFYTPLYANSSPGRSTAASKSSPLLNTRPTMTANFQGNTLKIQDSLKERLTARQEGLLSQRPSLGLSNRLNLGQESRLASRLQSRQESRLEQRTEQRLQTRQQTRTMQRLLPRFPPFRPFLKTPTSGVPPPPFVPAFAIKTSLKGKKFILPTDSLTKRKGKPKKFGFYVLPDLLSVSKTEYATRREATLPRLTRSVRGLGSASLRGESLGFIPTEEIRRGKVKI